MDDIRKKFYPIIDLLEEHVSDSEKLLEMVEKLLEIELTIRDHMK